MRQILKFPIGYLGRASLTMPRNADILDVQDQNGTLMIWAICDSAQPYEIVQIDVLGTGWEVPHDVGASEYLATVQQGSLVWHVFRVPNQFPGEPT